MSIFGWGSPGRCEVGWEPQATSGLFPPGVGGRTPGSQLPLAGWRGLPAKTRTLSRPSHICSMYRFQGVSEPSAPFLLAAEDREENQGP